ncbi:MAG: hypothetical protein IJ812_08450 [Schwartzia sp.]|nr:hypothetical protein [Schwartzia sp. (in: firmicutes)]
MSAEVRISKWLLVWLFLLAICAFCINYNIETASISLNSPLISNNLALNVIGGVMTGLMAVLLEKLYSYYLNKKAVRTFLWLRARLLYGMIYTLSRNVEQVIINPAVSPFNNMFGDLIRIINNISLEIYNTDYSLFWPNELLKAHKGFQIHDYMKIKLSMDGFIIYDLAISEFSLDENQYKMNLLEQHRNQMVSSIPDMRSERHRKIYDVLKVLNKFLYTDLRIVDSYLEAIQNDEPTVFDWNLEKQKIEQGYINPYNVNTVDNFLAKNPL